MQIRTMLLASIACLVLAGPASAGSGLYVGAGLGIESPAGSTWHVPSLSQFGQYSLKNSNTYLVNAGYKFDNGLRLELEGQSGRFDGHKITLHALSTLTSVLSGHISEATIYLNANYDFPIFMGWSGTIGAGIGSAWSDTHGSAFGGLSVLHGSDRAFAWQVGFGVIHKVLPDLDLQVDYRYQGIGSTTVTETGVGNFQLGNIRSQTVTASARFYILP